MNKPPHTFDEKLWKNILSRKQIRAFAWKIEKATQAEDESRDLVKMLMEKWAESLNVRHYFPDLADVFTPEAAFCLEYARQKSGEERRAAGDCRAGHTYCILAEISNLVARHNLAPAQLKRKYNHLVRRSPELKDTLPLFGVDEVEDGRITKNKYLYIPAALANQPTAQATKKKRVRAGTKTARLIEEQLKDVEPKFSIQNGRLRITM